RPPPGAGGAGKTTASSAPPPRERLRAPVPQRSSSSTSLPVHGLRHLVNGRLFCGRHHLLKLGEPALTQPLEHLFPAFGLGELPAPPPPLLLRRRQPLGRQPLRRDQ